MTDEQAHGITGAIQSVGGKLIGGLPAQFLALVAINTVFIVALLWFLNAQSAGRERVLSQIVTACLQDKR